MRRAVPVVVVLLSALASGCATSEEDKKSLQAGYALYNQRQPEGAEEIATKFIAANGASPNLDEGLYLRGLARLARANKAGAAEDLRQAIQKTARPDLKAKALRTLGDIAFDANTWKDAREAYEQALAVVPPPPAAAAAYLNYRIGACLQAVGQWDQAVPRLQQVIAAKGDPALAERAVARLNARAFALQFGAFADGRGAADLANALKAAGIAPTVTSELREGKLLYLVRSGSYPTWPEAEAARDRLLARYPVVTIVP
jgi:tetratricopeptide (TPR) repeat protein